MDTYHKIVEILAAVYGGANLKTELSKHIKDQHAAKLRNHCFGILRNNFAINYILSGLVKRPAIAVKLNIILQIAIFEIRSSHKPAYAVTNDIVNLTREIFANDKFNSFVNGVSRNYIRQQEIFETAIEKNYSLKYNLPEWFILKLKQQYKNNYKQILDGFDHHPAFGLRVNQRKIEFNDYLKLLTAAGISYGVVDQKLYLLKACDVYQLPKFVEGYVSVQDIAAQYSLDILTKNAVKPKLVLDACAAPGGKTCQLLEHLTLKITAVDIDACRIAKIEENIQRLDLGSLDLLSQKLVHGDAAQKKWWDGKAFDLILADVPCSATGTIKRNPDIKLNRSIEDIANFVKIQHDIVINLWSMLKDDGYLLYITCSIFQEENQHNIKYFSEVLPNFKIIDEIQIFPAEHNDSLYYALIKKEASK